MLLAAVSCHAHTVSWSSGVRVVSVTRKENVGLEATSANLIQWSLPHEPPAISQTLRYSLFAEWKVEDGSTKSPDVSQ
jgi:hypothetical protein